MDTKTEKSFELSPELYAIVRRFSFGVIVENNVFVDHFSSDSKFKDFKIIDSNIGFQNYRKKLLIQFTTFNETVIQSTAEDSTSEDSLELDELEDKKTDCHWITNQYIFCVNYSQIKSIHFKDNKLFIKLLFPPILYSIIKEDIEYDADGEEEWDGNEGVAERDANEELAERVANEEVLERDGNESNDSSPNAPLNTSFIDFDSGIEDMEDLLWKRADFDDDFEKGFDLIDSTVGSGNQLSEYMGFHLRTTKLFDINEENFTKISSISLEIEDKTCLSAIISNIKAFDPTILIEENCFETIECKPTPSPVVPDLPFGVEYSLQALTNHSFYLTDCLDYYNESYEQFVELIEELTEINEKSVEYSLNELQKKIENNVEMNPMEDLRQSFNRFKDQKQEKWTNSSVVSVRRCILTPTRVLLLPALPLQESRFLRTADPEYVLRILIKDEDFQLLSFTACKTSLPEEHTFVQQMKQFLYNCIENRLKNGIQIGQRFYELLGASTSQLRDHGLVLYARDGQNRNAQQIIESIGELMHFRNGAKFIARIGQSMSQSMGSVVDINCIEFIDDFFGGLNPKSQKPYCFSDGVGMISEDMAQELCAAFHIKYVSTFQIRFAGFKGLLVVNPELKGKQILMRESMKKFDSHSRDLDVLKVAEPRSCYLNRPLITILNRLGIASEEFLKLLYERHKQLANAYSCNCKAIQLIKDYSSLRFNFKELLNSGLDVLNDPFFVSLIESIIKKVSLDLRNKARILVPFDSGRVMFGVLDETKTLKYGQVFVQYTHQKTGTDRVLTGEVLVTKYPCMHGGDVRKLEAVDIPALYHIVNCVVFPAVGHRPHPDEMAGSDLDGDEYSVIWYKPLIFSRDNCRPMDFPYHLPQDLGRTISNSDILEFYCRFIANNQVGLIASSHLVWADYNSNGIFSHKCAKLEYKYAVSLDYAKTGINARISNEEKPNRYPDFMMKYSEKPTYESHKALGKLYQKNLYFYEVINEISKQKCFDFALNPKLIDEKADIYMSDAKDTFLLYRKAIKELKEQFGIDSESALVSSTFTKTHKYLCTHNDNNDVYDLISNIIKRLFDDFRQLFESGVNEEERLAKASAWYQISHQLNREESEANDKYYGFAWIVSPYLAQLALRNGAEKHDCSKQTFEEKSGKRYKISSIKEIVDIFLKESIEKKSIEKMSRMLVTGIEESVDKVIESYYPNEEEIPLSVLIHIFDYFSDSIDDYEDDQQFDVGMVALMANFKLKRLGLEEAITRQKTTEESIGWNDGNEAVVYALTAKLAEVISRDERLFDSLAKQLTGITQMAIKYGYETSHICVYGNRTAVEKFRKLIIRRFLSWELENGNFKHLYNF